MIAHTNTHMDTCVPSGSRARTQYVDAASSVWHVCSCLCAAGGQRGAVYQRQLVGGVCEDSHRAHPEESLPASPQLHRGEAATGGWERETGEAWICTHTHTHTHTHTQKNAQKDWKQQNESKMTRTCIHTCRARMLWNLLSLLRSFFSSLFFKKRFQVPVYSNNRPTGTQ